jgi:asparagine synthase (glutamine-hydrolysing)
VIAAGFSARPNANLRGRIADLAKLVGRRFDRIETREGSLVAAGSPGRMDEVEPLASIGADVEPGALRDEQRLRGPFAFAMARDRGLVLGCGRFGGHPLYYGRDSDGAVLACSQLDPLAQVLGCRSFLDSSRVSELAMGLPGGAATIYESIRRVRSSEVLRFEGARETRSALEPITHRPEVLADPREIAEELLRLVDAAVARAIGSAQKVAVSVGGLDSSGLLATLVARSRGASKSEALAITLHFEGLNDDRPYVRDLCNALGIEPIRFTPAHCARFFLQPIVIDGAPNVHPQAPWSLEAARRAKAQGIELLLKGDGGDELFNGDPGVFAEVALKGHLVRAIRDVGRLRGVPELEAPLTRLSTLLLRPLARKCLPRLRTLLQEARVRRRAASEFSWIRPALRPALDRLLHWDRTKDLSRADVMLEVREFYHQCFVETGCPTALPYFDEDLVAFVESLPKELLFHTGYKRGLFRFAFRDILPESVRLRETKSGFGQAFAETFAAAGGVKKIEPYLDLRRISELDLVDLKKFAIEVQRLVREPHEPNRWLTLWPVIAMECFLRTVRDERDIGARSAAAS